MTSTIPIVAELGKGLVEPAAQHIGVHIPANVVPNGFAALVLQAVLAPGQGSPIAGLPVGVAANDPSLLAPLPLNGAILSPLEVPSGQQASSPVESSESSVDKNAHASAELLALIASMQGIPCGQQVSQVPAGLQPLGLGAGSGDVVVVERELFPTHSSVQGRAGPLIYKDDWPPGNAGMVERSDVKGEAVDTWPMTAGELKTLPQSILSGDSVRVPIVSPSLGEPLGSARPVPVSPPLGEAQLAVPQQREDIFAAAPAVHINKPELPSADQQVRAMLGVDGKAVQPQELRGLDTGSNSSAVEVSSGDGVGIAVSDNPSSNEQDASRSHEGSSQSRQAQVIVPGEKPESIAVPPAHEVQAVGSGSDSAAKRQRVMDQVIERVETLQITSGRQEVSIRLEPQHLGKIHVTIVSNGSEVSARMVAETSTAASALQSDKGRLEESLKERGYNLEQLDVSLGQQSTFSSSSQRMPWDMRAQEQLQRTATPFAATTEMLPRMAALSVGQPVGRLNVLV